MFALWTKIKCDMINSGQKHCTHIEKASASGVIGPLLSRTFQNVLRKASASLWKPAHVVSVCVCGDWMPILAVLPQDAITLCSVAESLAGLGCADLARLNGQ